MSATHDRAPLRLRALAHVAVLGLGLSGFSGCQKHGDKQDGANDSAAEAGDPADGPSAEAKDDRIPTLAGAPVGLLPGYVEGAMFYASWRAGSMQALLQSLPMSPREAKDVAEIGMVLGADPRVDDVLAHLGIDPDARISLSVRPVVNWAAELRQALASDSPVLRELNSHTGGGDGWEPKVDPNDVAEIAEYPQQDNGIEPPPPPEPAPLSAAARELERKAKSLGVHVRVHLPIATPGKIDHMVNLMAQELRGSKWSTTCAALGPSRVCGGESDGVVVVRDVAGGLQLDWLLTFDGDYEHPDDEFRRALIQEAVAAPAASSVPALAALRGEGVLLVDGPGMVTALRASALSSAIRSLSEDYGDDHWRARQREREDALRSLHETERMFEGVTVELQLDGDKALALGKWLPTTYGRAHLAEVFELSNIDADVPSVAALCDGALVCGRSRGLPDRKRFAPLATGIYAQPEQLGRQLDRFEEESTMVLMLETWPNALGTLARLPGTTIEPPESFIVQNVIDVSSRVLAGGFSIRSLSETRRALTGDWVGYLRMTSADLGALGGFLQMADSRLAPASVSGVEGRVEFTPIPDKDVPGNFYAIHDLPAASGAWGWAVLADGDDRVSWLAGLPHDDGAAPLLYLEAGDLWRLVASFEEGREDLGFAQSWLSRRWVRGQVSVGEGGAPEVRIAMGKLD